MSSVSQDFVLYSIWGCLTMETGTVFVPSLRSKLKKQTFLNCVDYTTIVTKDTTQWCEEIYVLAKGSYAFCLLLFTLHNYGISTASKQYITQHFCDRRLILFLFLFLSDLDQQYINYFFR